MVLHSDAYNSQPIRLLSCNTGRLADGFAQNLANFMNVEVSAPTKYIWAYHDGKHIVENTNGMPATTDIPILRDKKIYKLYLIKRDKIYKKVKLKLFLQYVK